MSTYFVVPLLSQAPVPTVKVVGARSGDEAIKLAELGRGNRFASVKAVRLNHDSCSTCHEVIFPEDFCYRVNDELFCKFHARAAKAAALASKAG